MHSVGLQTANTQEEGNQLQHLFMFTAVQCLCSGVQHPCSVKSSLLVCMLFLTVEMPTVAIWLVFQLQQVPCAAMFWLKCEGQLTTRSVLFLVLARWSWTWFMLAQARLIPHLNCTVLSTQEPCPRPPF